MTLLSLAHPIIVRCKSNTFSTPDECYLNVIGLVCLSTGVLNMATRSMTVTTEEIILHETDEYSTGRSAQKIERTQVTLHIANISATQDINP
jgi:hypothetical protein